MAASEPKKRRVVGVQSEYGISSSKEQGKDKNGRHWISAMMTLCTNNTLCYITLTPLKIINCNASTCVGSSFPKAFCETEYFQDGLVFGDIFQNGMDILVEYMKNKTFPENKGKFLVLSKLLKFMNEDRTIGVHDNQDLQRFSEAELTILVANHLLGRLAISSCYLVDKNCIGRKGDQCFCGEDSCKMTGDYGDTSVGNVDVWHGNLDIVINNDLAVEPVEDKTESPSGKSPVEVKLKTVLSRNPQIIAQTIVFSFLQKKTHPERDSFLTPCIGIGSSDLIVMFYDSEHDVLLESSSIPLFNDPFSFEFSYTAIIVSWLVVNYKFLCTGLPDHMKTYKSDFFVHAGKKIKIYEEKLAFGNVISSQTTEGRLKFCPRVKCTPKMHEHEKILQEVLWSLESSSGSSESASKSYM
ncbi:uncharacterized protein LOC133204806 [Saccostrea echinata]|uniref:uncharacterized protein LOC133204806 n=1 Tax=Saccostrea echinata TaxID=191078 RepID=UPI002A7F781E|nr:uncharacterized protein LOC133204806 [Saccostrea echinata]